MVVGIKIKIVVGASPAPHAEIFEKAKPLLKKKGYDLEIKTINDYTTPNKLLDKGELMLTISNMYLI